MIDSKRGEGASSQSLSEPRQFARDIVWVGLAQVFAIAIGILTLPALTRSYTSETFGIWMQVSITVTFLTPLITLQLGNALVRFLSGESDKERKRQALGAMLSAVLGVSFLGMGVTTLMAHPLSSFLFASPAFTTYVRLTFMWALVEALFLLFIAYLRADNKIKVLSIILVGVYAVRMGLIVTLAKSGFSLQWVIVSQVVADSIFSFIVFGMIVKDIGFPWPNVAGLKTFLAFSVPQMPSSALGWIVSSSDRYFITHMLTLSQAGIYTSSRNLGALTALFYIPIGFVLYPALTKHWEQGNPSAVRTYLEYSTKLFLTMAIPAVVGISILSQPLLKILTTSEFLVGGELVLLVAIGTIFLGVYQTNIYVVLLEKKTKWMPLFMAGAASASVGMNIILIPRIGITGAAVSSLVSYGVLATIVSIWARRVVNYRIDLKYLSKVIVASFMMGLCLWVMNPSGPFGIILGAVSGTLIFGAELLLMRAFSTQDKLLLRETFGGLIPILHSR